MEGIYLHAAEKRGAVCTLLNTVNAVRTEERRLALFTDQPFYREWIMEETNRKALNNLISYYTDAPKGFELEVEVRKKRKTEGTAVIRGVEQPVKRPATAVREALESKVKDSATVKMTARCKESSNRDLISLKRRRIRWTGKENGNG